MLISTWLTAVRDRYQASRVVKRRSNQKQATNASENLETRSLLTTTLQAVRPNVGEFLTPGEVRTVAPQELTLQFSLGSTITPSTISNQSIQVFRSGQDGAFGTANDVPVTIGYVGVGSVPNEVVLRFGENLIDEHYRIVVNGTGANSLDATVMSPTGPVDSPVVNATFDFELDLGAKVIAVDPQPVTRATNGTLSQARDQIVLYFNEDDLNPAAAQNVNFYQLIYTNETVSSLDDVLHTPSSAVYSSVNNTVTLTFPSDIASLSGAGSYRLRVGNSESIPLAPNVTPVGADPGSSFDSSMSFGNVNGSTNSSFIFSSSIDAQFMAFSFPGAGDEPGHRDIEVENHLGGGADVGTTGIPFLSYNFQDIYGVDPQGNVLHNAITEAQKERAREVFAYYSEKSGIDFRETANSGLTIVTGDMRALDPAIPTGPGGVAGLAGGGIAIMDFAENWGNLPGESWFNVAMHEIGHLLGQGHTYDLPDPTVQGAGPSGSAGTGVEPTLLGDHDIVHMQHMFRPDSVDIDLYKFRAMSASIFSAEIMAERMANSSTLDSVLRLYKEVNGQRELVAQNDNYFSKDSFLELTLEPGVYYLGVSSTGNDAYDPTVQNTGVGGTSQGTYDLRLNFRPNVIGAGSAIVDTTGRTFDGDSDGIEGGVYNFWFKTASAADTLFVDKSNASFLGTAITAAATTISVERTAPFAVNDVIRIGNEQMRVTAVNATNRTLTVLRAQNATAAASHSLDSPVRKVSANGALTTPFGFISDALALATSGQVVRVLGNAGADANSATLNDSFPYEIGLNTSNQPLADGAALEAPRGVTVMIDKGAVVKLRRGWLGTGSSTTSVDRSGSALQVLGTPNRQVIMTSWNDETIGADTTLTPTIADEGDWGGIIFRNEIDRAQNRFNPENEGLFLNYVAFADVRWGGGTVTIDSTTQTINPIHMDRSQPTIVNNTIQFTNDSAMSADPDSFEELTFHSPRFQTGKPAFAVDYKRIGPEIYGNTLLNNGNNALFVRIDTVAGGATQKLTVPGRFNDTDIVHLVAQNLEIQGTPGGAFRETVSPSVTLVTLNSIGGGTLAAGTYSYRVVFTDENGFESPASSQTGTFVLGAAGSIRLAQLPTVPTGSIYTGRRIYRSSNTGAGTFTLIADLDKSTTVYTDNGRTLARTLPTVPTGARDRARLDARLSVDPGIIVKLQGARIEAEFGAQLIAEGAPGRQVIFTSRLDDRYGAGGTFDTNNDDNAPTESTPAAGNWGGLYIGHTGHGSIDRALITFAGGSVPVGGGFAAFNPVEIHEAKVRIRNTTFETNASGQSSGNRSGLFGNAPGTIFVRGAQPIVLDNTFIGNAGPIININVNSLNKSFVADTGRSTGAADLQLNYGDNQGALIRDNILERNSQNGMIVRGETITTHVIWDDTDVVHIVQDEIYIPNLHTYGGVRLESSSTESLVVKLNGPTAGFTAGGSTIDITDRIGGMLHVIGQPGQPVIMTSLSDDTVGAGYNLQGLLQKDTNGNGASTGVVGGWRGIDIDQYSHDRNVAVYVENEIADRQSADTNATPSQAENIGSLAQRQQWGDENLRLGVDLQGFIDNSGDVDVYSFSGVAGSLVWIDIDRTTHGLDTVVELLDTTGAILAQSDNYFNEKIGTWQVVTSAAGDVQAGGLDFSPYLSDDQYSTNTLDAGFRVVLPGTEGIRATYLIRVRSSNIDSATAAPRADLQDNSKVGNGLTTGVYQLQVRLQETDEFAGTTVQFADIRFARTGINIIGQPGHSPLTGESEEVEGTTGQLGNLMDSDRAALAVRGTINAVNDVDLYQFEVNYTRTQQIGGVSLTAPHVPVVFDLDYADGLARADMSMAIYDSAGRLILIGRDSNITDDQAGPREGSDTDDLTRGSVGTFDPFVGAVELPGGVYSLAVFNNRQVPAVLDQFFNAGSSSPLLRVEPINSTNRIFEERFGADDNDPTTYNDLFTSANAPVTDLFNVDQNGELDGKHAVPWHLGDVVLFVSQNGGISGTNESTIRTINPFTGRTVTTLGQFGPSVGDIAMRPDGQLYSFTTGPQGTGESTSGPTGNYLRIDTGTAGISVVGDDGVTANRDNRDANGFLTPGDNNVTTSNAGMIYQAMTYIGTGDNDLFAVGERAIVTEPAASSNVSAYDDNILYRFNIRTGAVNGRFTDRINDNRAYDGAGTTQVEIGQINALGTVTGMAFAGGTTYVVDDLGNLYTVNVSNAATTQIGTTSVGNQNFRFTSLVAAPDGVENGAYDNVLFAMTDTGRLVAFYRRSIPALSQVAGQLAPVFFDGQSSVQTTITAGNGGVGTGLAFSTLDRNLWATTTHRGDDPGHGVETRFDDSILANRQQGSRSLYFGNQTGGADQGNQNNLDGTLQRNVNFPGGAHGTVVSNEFSLQGYDRNDKPMLYFNYFLQTENALSDPDANSPILMRDAFRVFVADESGEWNLVSTNNSFDNSNRFDEFDYGPDGTFTQAPVTQTFPDVVETFDNTTTWRQARIDLSNFAGRSNLRLRFDFSTAGSMGLGRTFTTGSELRAVAGEKLRDGDIFTIDGVNFEFDMGSTLVMPSGAAAIGQSFTVGGETFTFAAAAGGANTIVVLATDSPASVATKAAAVVNANGVLGVGSALLPLTPGGNRVTFPGRTVTASTAALTLNGADGVAGTSRAVVVTPRMTANQVALVMRQAIADEFSAGDIDNIKGSEELVWIIGHDVDANGPLGFADSLPGDTFGAFNTSFDNNTGNRPGSLRGMNNAVEGVYVDDIVLGFAERGEMVVNAAANTGFTVNRDIEDAYPAGNEYLGIDLGAYDVEIRRATDYALTEDGSPTNTLYKAIDTNDREANLVSVTLPAASRLVDGATLTLSDGGNQVIFQFLDAKGSTTLIQGAFPIFFDPAAGGAGDHDNESSVTIAARLRDAINGATVQNVLRVKASLSDGTDTGALSTSSTLHLTGNALVTLSPALNSSVIVTNYLAYGDQNHHRDQGQLIIRSSSITRSQQFGIVADAAPRVTGSSLTGPGSVRNLHTINDEGLVTGVVIMNNVIAGNVAGGIRFSGDQAPGAAGPVPYGRIVNNTIVGVGAGLGIQVEQSASPTILNNIIADFGTGIDVDLSSVLAGTTIGSTLFSGNGTNSNAGLGAFPIVLAASEPLFVDKARGNYYLAPNSRAIDSSLTSLGDRDAILRIKAPLDLDGRDDQGSPIIAPEFDLYGQLRGNDPDVETPAGQGASVLFDRGAIDRVDFAQPQAQLANPEDQSLIDGDADIDEVWIDQVQTLRQFRIRLIDEGIGIDHTTVNKDQFVLKRVLTDGVTEVILVEGVDYTFAYNEVTREAILTAATFFADENTEVRYILLVDNDGFSTGDTSDGPRDLAGNYLLANKADGTTRFDIVLTDGVNDAPQITAPATASVNEDTNLVFGSGTISVFDQDAHLGTNVLTVSLTARQGLTIQGLLTLATIPSGLTFSIGDGTADSAMTFTGRLQDINTALNSLRFRATQDYNGAASVTIDVDDLGEFSGPAAVSQHVINITVVPVNDAPTFTIPATAPTILEDAGSQTVTGFMTGQVPGPANESGQSITAELTVSSEVSAWTVGNFFLVAPSINTTNGNLTYTVNPDVNGTATISVLVRDGLGLASVVRTFTITVTPRNDVPVYTRNPGLPVPSLEDSALVSVDLINTFAAARDTALDEIGNQPLTWTIASQTRTSGNLAFEQLVIGIDGTLQYKPAANTAGTIRMAIVLSDGIANATTMVITVSVTQVNDAPVARTRNYVVDEGYGIVLDARSSTDADDFFGDTRTYLWDLNGDGIFETNAGASATLSRTWAQLAAAGITAPGRYTAAVRVTDAAGLSSIGTGTLTTFIVDYGDAPDSYGTTRGNNGAAHTIAGGLQLGASRDKETDGQPTVRATGDGADEDGVQFPTTLETTTTDLRSFVDVTSVGGGKLDVWLDLNQNGVFDHATEHLNNGTSWTLAHGVNRIFFTIPANTQLGLTMMRFRLSSVGSLLPTGRANTGEVEDYQVEIFQLQPPVQPQIVRPVDFNTSDGLIPLTTDATPTVVWSLNLPVGTNNPNLNYELIVRNAANQVVFERLAGDNLTALFQTINDEANNRNLLPGVYTISLRAFNKAGTASAVSTYQFEVVGLQIANPTGSETTPRPEIVWNHVAGTTAYTIQIVSKTNNATVFFRTITVSSMANPGRFTLPSDLALGNYDVRVRATDAANLPGDWSPFSNFQIRTAPVITGPTGVVTSVRPTITWTRVLGAVRYEMELRNLTDNTVVVDRSDLVGASFTPSTNLTLGEYLVVMRAFNASGVASVFSSSFRFNVAPIPTVISPTGRLNDATPTFGWNAVPAADAYELTVRRAFGDLGIVFQSSSLTGTIHSLTQALPLGRYTWTIRALNNATATGQPTAFSSSSAVVPFTVTAAPVIISPPSTTFLPRPTVTWSNPPLSAANAISELILNKKEGSATIRVLVQRNITGTSFTIPRDLQLGTYVVSVRTYSTADPATVSEWSISRTFRVTVAPTLIGPSGRVADATPTLNWNGVLGGQTYRVVVTSLSNRVTAYDLSGVNALNFTIPSDMPIGRYRFTVQARSAFGDISDFSTPLDFQVVAAPVLSGPSASTFDTTPTFNWTSLAGTVGSVVGGATNYDFVIERQLPDNTWDDAFLSRNVTVTTFTATTALAAGQYRAKVRGKSSDTVGEFSSYLPFYVGGQPIVSRVGNASGVTTDTTPTITWQAVDGASGYDIFIALQSSPTVAVIQQSGIGATSFTVSAPLPKGAYRVWVRAVNGSTGQFSIRSVAVDFTIADASEIPSTVAGGQYQLTAVQENLEQLSSESTISMLPSFISGSAYRMFVVAEQNVDADLQLAGDAPAPAEGSAVTSEQSAPQTDEVLSQWDEQKWWDSAQNAAPAAPVATIAPVEEKKEQVSASAGILGAILALAPRSLRRRRRDDSST